MADCYSNKNKINRELLLAPSDISFKKSIKEIGGTKQGNDMDMVGLNSSPNLFANKDHLRDRNIFHPHFFKQHWTLIVMNIVHFLTLTDNS